MKDDLQTQRKQKRKGALIRINSPQTSAQHDSGRYMESVLGFPVRYVTHIRGRVKYYSLPRRSLDDLRALRAVGFAAHMLWSPFPDDIHEANEHWFRYHKNMKKTEVALRYPDGQFCTFRIPDFFWTLDEEVLLQDELVRLGLNTDVVEWMFHKHNTLTDKSKGKPKHKKSDPHVCTASIVTMPFHQLVRVFSAWSAGDIDFLSSTQKPKGPTGDPINPFPNPSGFVINSNLDRPPKRDTKNNKKSADDKDK